ncbi:MAG: HupE/UreJ family protein [Acidobacteriota bacterium]
MKSRRTIACAILLLVLGSARAVLAHPAPFSYLDLRLAPSGLAGTVVLHDFDVAHELSIATPDSLMDPAVLARHAAAIEALVTARFVLTADGRDLAWVVTDLRPLADRSAIQLSWRAAQPIVPGKLELRAAIFPYDPNHQTFVNFYEGDALTRQEILDVRRPEVVFYTGTRQGAVAVFTSFTASGIRHIAIGPDHILFIVGLLLLGGSVPRLLGIVSAFTVGHSITLSLAALGIVTPPARIIEPAIALSIVYVGADNLLSGAGARDVRAWIALFFGLVHGFGFASVLRETGLPPRALGISLFSFNLGVEIGQAVIVVIVASALGIIRARHPGVARRIVTVGSAVVIAAGVFWFIQRV